MPSSSRRLSSRPDPRRRSGPQGRTWAACAFGLWVGAVIPGLVWLGREGCRHVPTTTQPLPTREHFRQAWSLRHQLPANHPLTPQVAGLLERRGPAPGLRAEIVMDGNAPALTERLRAAGWKVRENPGPHAAVSPSPRLEISNARDEPVWTGHYRPGDLSEPGATVLESLVLSALHRGEPVPAYVPIGCGPSPAALLPSFAALLPRPNRSP